jgi:hypothetical protein
LGLGHGVDERRFLVSDHPNESAAALGRQMSGNGGALRGGNPGGLKPREASGVLCTKSVWIFGQLGRSQFIRELLDGGTQDLMK